MTPTHQVTLRSAIDLPGVVFVDWIFRYASQLPAAPAPAHDTSSIRVAWRRGQLEIAAIGQDLHDERHREWPSDTNAGIRRCAYVSLTWHQ